MEAAAQGFEFGFEGFACLAEGVGLAAGGLETAAEGVGLLAGFREQGLGGAALADVLAELVDMFCEDAEVVAGFGAAFGELCAFGFEGGHAGGGAGEFLDADAGLGEFADTLVELPFEVEDFRTVAGLLVVEELAELVDLRALEHPFLLEAEVFCLEGGEGFADGGEFLADGPLGLLEPLFGEGLFGGQAVALLAGFAEVFAPFGVAGGIRGHAAEGVVLDAQPFQFFFQGVDDFPRDVVARESPEAFVEVGDLGAQGVAFGLEAGPFLASLPEFLDEEFPAAVDGGGFGEREGLGATGRLEFVFDALAEGEELGSFPCDLVAEGAGLVEEGLVFVEFALELVPASLGFEAGGVGGVGVGPELVEGFGEGGLAGGEAAPHLLYLFLPALQVAVSPSQGGGGCQSVGLGVHQFGGEGVDFGLEPGVVPLEFLQPGGAVGLHDQELAACGVAFGGGLFHLRAEGEERRGVLPGKARKEGGGQEEGGEEFHGWVR